MESSSPPARFRGARTAYLRSACPFLPAGTCRATWRKPHLLRDIRHVWWAVIDLRAGKAEATVETPHPHRDPAAVNTRESHQSGHNGTISMFEATAATACFNVEGFALGPAAAAHEHLVTLCNRLHRRNRLIQRSMSAYAERGHRRDPLRFHRGDHRAARASRCLHPQAQVPACSYATCRESFSKVWILRHGLHMFVVPRRAPRPAPDAIRSHTHTARSSRAATPEDSDGARGASNSRTPTA